MNCAILCTIWGILKGRIYQNSNSQTYYSWLFSTKCTKTKKSQISLRLDFERKTRLEPAFAGIFRELYLHPLTPWKGWVGSLRASLVSTEEKQPVWTAFLRWAENESLSICSPLCISSNCLCPVLYPQFEGHLGYFKVSFSGPTFAIQTSELQLLTTNLRIIFELTKSKRDGFCL